MSPALRRAGGGVLCVTITSTLSRTSSFASLLKRSVCPSAQRYSITRLRPSTQPNSRIRCTKVAVHWLCAAALPVPSNPMVAAFACCARAASGHAAAPPSNVMNSRRLTARCLPCSDRKDSTPRHGRLLHTSSWAARDDRDHAAENFFQGGSPKQATPFPRQDLLTAKNSFRASFRGWRL